MDRNLTLYQLSPERAAKIFDRIDMFNRGRTETNGKYVISMPTPYRPYYGFWRIFLNDNAPLFIRTLAVTFDAAAERAFALLQNCNVLLDVQDNAVFESCYGQSDDIIPFGKYRGKRLAEIFYVDPSYVLWLANKFVVETKRYEPLVLLAKKFAKVHFELTIQKKHISSVSRVYRRSRRQAEGYVPDCTECPSASGYIQGRFLCRPECAGCRPRREPLYFFRKGCRTESDTQCAELSQPEDQYT